MPGRSGLWVALVVSVVLTACTGASDLASPVASKPSQGLSQAPSTSALPTSASAVPTSASAAPSSSAPAPAGVLVDRPWATATLTDVTTGEPFRIADLVASGKVVLLETMAIWCSNCRAQQVEATVAFEGAEAERVVWVAIDVESFETADALARYREQNGFPFTYAIADAEYARSLVDDFGEIVLSPPSVNIIVIGTDGRISHSRGHKSADELRRLAAEYGA